MNMKKIILALAVLLLVSITSIAVADCEHSWEWKWDSKSHWQECVLCGEKTDSEEHTLEINVLTNKGKWVSGRISCNICGVYEDGNWEFSDEIHWFHFPTFSLYSVGSPHDYEWQWDGNSHWKECICGAKTESESHQIEWKMDADTHWKECAICGAEGDQSYHRGYYCDQGEPHCYVCGAKESDGAVIRMYAHIVDGEKPIQVEKTTHTFTCGVCGDKVTENHYSDCPNTDVCRICGATEDDGIVIKTVYHSWDGYTYSETEHWHHCERCGNDYHLNVHWAYCDAPNVCAECGKSVADGIVIDAVYHDWDDYSYNETEHWHHCERCGNDYDVGTHWAYCDAPDVCAVCGKSVADGIVIDEVYHLWNDDYSYNETEHWKHCERCGNDYNRDVHWAYCDVPNVCAVCGKSVADGIVIDEVYHLWNDDYSYNETEHWKHCERCGNDYNLNTHWATCFAPDVCATCGCSYSGEVSHVNNNLDEYTPYDEIYHQFECEYGHGLILEEHFFVDGVCALCGYAESTAAPTVEPTAAPTAEPTVAPTAEPTIAPTAEATVAPMAEPTAAPTAEPTVKPTEKPDDGAEWRYHQNVSSLGIRFRDIKPEVTNEWLMFTPLDLSQDGVQEIDLIAANITYVGKVTVTVSSGKVTVTDDVNHSVEKLNLQFTLLPDLASVTSADISAMKTYEFGQEISIADDLAGDTKVLLFVTGYVNYDFKDSGNELFRGSSVDYQQLVEQLKEIMD